LGDSWQESVEKAKAWIEKNHNMTANDWMEVPAEIENAFEWAGEYARKLRDTELK
jgi:hypothetical protein